MEHLSNLVVNVSGFVERNGHAVAEKVLIEWLSILMLVSAFIVGFGLFVLKHKVSYGRYSKESVFSEYSLDSRLGWFLQEAPSLFVPLIAYFRMQNINLTSMNFWGVTLFIIHYFQRTVIYAYLIRSGKTLPIHYMLAGIVFTTWNGYLQGHYHGLYADFEHPFLPHWIRVAGVVIFFTGFLINIDADSRLRNLRSDPSDKSYKIPKGGMFEFVSGANFFGEILEWFGYALFCQTLPAIAFSLFTFANTAPRAIEHHKWYLKKFDNYPKDRKAVIPFLL